MSEYAKFNATLADVKFNGKKTVIKLEVDNKSAASNITFLMQNSGEMVVVNLGDPQMKMEFQEERKGISGTIGPSGVVESVSAPEDKEDEDQSKLDFDEDSADDGVSDLDFADEEPETEKDSDIEVEWFILTEQPTFEDIEYNFPEILRKRREEGRTWMELASEHGVSSWTFQKEWKKYVERVTAMIGTAS